MKMMEMNQLVTIIFLETTGDIVLGLMFVNFSGQITYKTMNLLNLFPNSYSAASFLY